MLLMMCCTSVFAASFADTYGFSARGIALGNAMTARVNDWSSVYYNMAGLGRTVYLKNAAVPETADKAGLSLKKNEGGAVSNEQHAYVNDLAVTYLCTIPSLKIDIKRKDLDGKALPTDAADIDPYGFAILGLAVDMNYIYKLPSFISSARIGLGMGANDDLSAVKLNDIDLRTHNFQRYGREAQMAVIMAGAGFGFLNDMFGFGGGATVSFSGEGVVQMEGVGMKSTSQYPWSQTKMDLSISPSVNAGTYFSPGQILPILKGLDLGASYRQETYMKIDPFDATARAMDGAVNMRMIIGILDYYSPHTITGGVAYTIWKITVSADIEYQMWSKFKANGSNKYWYTEDNATEYAPGDDTNLEGKLPKMKDVVVYRLGVEYQMFSWVSLMCGAYYQPSFVPDSATSGDLNILDNDKYVGSVGANFSLPRMFGFGGPVEITVAYQMQYLADRNATKNSTANFTTSYNPNYTYGGTNHSGMLGLVLKL